MNASDPPPTTRQASHALWRVAEAFMHLLYNLFGGPEDVARDNMIATRAYKELASWLACAEAMLRRLLLIEAAALPKPVLRQRMRAKRLRVRRAVEFWPDKPEEWRVHFRCFPSSPVHGRSSSARSAMTEGARRGANFRDAWPLAERYEALLRVYNDPAPYARRLAHRLYAAPLRASALLHARPEAPTRIERFDEMGQTAARERDRLFDSS